MRRTTNNLQLVYKMRLTTPCVGAEIITSFLCVYLDGDDDDSYEFLWWLT